MKRSRLPRDSDEETHLTLRCAELYYYGDRTQSEVARELGITRLRVNRLLRRARQEGLVRIQVVDPRSASTGVASALAERFGLREAVVVPSHVLDGGGVALDLGRSAADWLRTHLAAGMVVGVGWGYSVAATIRHLVSGPRPPQAAIQAVPLLGALGDSRPEFRSNDLARDLAEAFGGQWQPLDLPFLVDRPEVRQALLEDTALRPAVSLWERLDVALIGIGYTISRSPLLRTPHFTKDDIVEMERLGIVGDVLSRFFDARGTVPELGFYGRLIGIDLSTLRRGALVVGVAGGLEKVPSILGALRGHHVDVLVTDERTARAIPEQPDAPVTGGAPPGGLTPPPGTTGRGDRQGQGV